MGYIPQLLWILSLPDAIIMEYSNACGLGWILLANQIAWLAVLVSQQRLSSLGWLVTWCKHKKWWPFNFTSGVKFAYFFLFCVRIGTFTSYLVRVDSDLRQVDPCPHAGFSTQPMGRDQPVLGLSKHWFLTQWLGEGSLQVDTSNQVGSCFKSNLKSNLWMNVFVFNARIIVKRYHHNKWR